VYQRFAQADAPAGQRTGQFDSRFARADRPPIFQPLAGRPKGAIGRAHFPLSRARAGAVPHRAGPASDKGRMKLATTSL